MKRTVLFLILMVMIINIFSACSDNEKESENESTDEYEILMEPTTYTTKDEFIDFMIEKISEKKEAGNTDETDISTYCFDYYYEPDNLPPDTVFKKISVREGVYIGVWYSLGGDISENNVLIYEWHHYVDEEGLEIFLNDNKGMYKEATVGSQLFYYYEEPVSDTDNTVLNREFLFLADGTLIHVILPGFISLDEAYKYISVKKVFYTDN